MANFALKITLIRGIFDNLFLRFFKEDFVTKITLFGSHFNTVLRSGPGPK